MNKTCSKCGQDKPCTEFHKDKANKDGLRSDCKVCVRARGGAHYRNNKDKIKERSRKYYHENIETCREKMRQRRISNPDLTRERKRWYGRKSTYGITKDQFMGMLHEQGEQCAICGASIDVTASVDHCHTTGKIRGILCATCNQALGVFGDNLTGLMRAVRYLEKAENDKCVGSAEAPVRGLQVLCSPCPEDSH